MKSFTEQLNKLERLAKDATPGGEPIDWLTCPDAKFLQAANPQMILELVKRFRAMEACPYICEKCKTEAADVPLEEKK